MSTKGRIVTLLAGDCNTTRLTNSLELEFFSVYFKHGFSYSKRFFSVTTNHEIISYKDTSS